MISSHEYAAKLQRVAQFLMLQEEFQVNVQPDFPHDLYYWDRGEFGQAARAMGAGQKKFDDNYLCFTPTGCKELRLCYVPF